MLKSLLNKVFGIKREAETNETSFKNTVKEKNTNLKESSRDLGISLFQEEIYEEAHKIFEKLNNEYPTSENNFFLSLTTLIRGENTVAIKLFEQAINTFELDVDNVQHSIPNMKILFADELIQRGNFTLAFRLLKEVSNIYSEYKILDTTFLIMRGIPIFEYYLEILEKVKGKVDKIEFEALISKLEMDLGKDSKLGIDYIIRKIEPQK